MRVWNAEKQSPVPKCCYVIRLAKLVVTDKTAKLAVWWDFPRITCATLRITHIGRLGRYSLAAGNQNGALIPYLTQNIGPVA